MWCLQTFVSNSVSHELKVMWSLWLRMRWADQSRGCFAGAVVACSDAYLGLMLPKPTTTSTATRSRVPLLHAALLGYWSFQKDHLVMIGNSCLKQRFRVICAHVSASACAVTILQFETVFETFCVQMLHICAADLFQTMFCLCHCAHTILLFTCVGAEPLQFVPVIAFMLFQARFVACNLFCVVLLLCLVNMYVFDCLKRCFVACAWRFHTSNLELLVCVVPFRVFQAICFGSVECSCGCGVFKRCFKQRLS